MYSMAKPLLGMSAFALAAALGAGQALAFDPLPNLVNLDFSQYNGSTPKGYFTNVNPVGWVGGGGLIFIDSTTDFAQSAAGPVYLTTYGNPSGSVTGNYVEADGNPDYEGSFSYEVTGLTVGKTYTLSFYQGASQQTTFASGIPTTNQWIVSLGTTGLSVGGSGPVDPIYGPTATYFSSDPNASIEASPLMTVPSAGVVGWNYVSVNLTADSTSDLLSFLAWGDKGSTINLPPIAFLSGVNSPPGLGATPEPATWAMMGIGFVGLAGAAWRRRNKRPVSAVEV
jgi:hypothetical protein